MNIVVNIRIRVRGLACMLIPHKFMIQSCMINTSSIRPKRAGKEGNCFGPGNRAVEKTVVALFEPRTSAIFPLHVVTLSFTFAILLLSAATLFSILSNTSSTVFDKWVSALHKSKM